MTTFSLSAPPPSVNHMFANVPKKGRVKTDRYRTWLTAMGWEIKAQRPEKIAGEVLVDITVAQSSGDIDNRIKAVLDLCVLHQLIEDDRHVQEVRARWGTEPGCQISIEEYRRSYPGVRAA